jgi:hypothetical protein
VFIEAVARRQVLDFINGLKCTIFCYGQTSFGKTHNLFGKDTKVSKTPSWPRSWANFSLI